MRQKYVYIPTFLLILYVFIPTGCGKIDMHQVHQNMCYQENQKIGMLELEVDTATELIRQNNEEWQKTYDDKICLCQVQDMSYDVQ